MAGIGIADVGEGQLAGRAIDIPSPLRPRRTQRLAVALSGASSLRRVPKKTPETAEQPPATPVSRPLTMPEPSAHNEPADVGIGEAAYPRGWGQGGSGIWLGLVGFLWCTASLRRALTRAHSACPCWRGART